LIQDQSKTPLYILIAVTGIILLIAMANAANLLLARSAARRRELATCSAIGAGRGRIMRQLLSEALILAVAGGTLGIGIAVLAVRFLISLMTQTSTPIDFMTVQPDWRALFFGFGLSVFTGLLFGLYPALQAAGMSPVHGLIRNSARVSEAFGAARVRKTLVCAQVTLSIILLVPTGLLLKSLVNMMKVELGFRTDNMITFQTTPYEAGYSAEGYRTLYERVETQLTALPGVTGIAMNDHPLMYASFNSTPVRVEDLSSGEFAWAGFTGITPGFFGHMGIPLIQGREFTERDNSSGKSVVIINEKFARTFFPGRNPIGRNISWYGGSTSEVVGVVKDSRLSSVRQPPKELVYRPWLQNSQHRMFFYIRTGMPPDRLMPQVRLVMREIDPKLPLTGMQTMEDQISSNIQNDRIMLQLAGLFAVLALSLAMLGLYGVVAYSVIRRTREFGIRIAVGAQRSGIRRLVLRETAMILLAGLIVGIPVVVVLCNMANSQWLSITPGIPGAMSAGNPESRLFGVSASDPMIIAGACIALGLAALVASYLPAWRASHIDPMKALRFE
jgi:predicted permease